MNKNLFEELAACNELQGNDLRVIMFCYKRFRTQKHIQEWLKMKKTNCSTTVNKLIKIGILERTTIDNTNYYRVNENWIPAEIPGQVTLKEVML